MVEKPKWWWSRERREAYDKARAEEREAKRLKKEKDALNGWKRRLASHRAAGKYRIVQQGAERFYVEMLNHAGYWGQLDPDGLHIHAQNPTAPHPYISLEVAHAAGRSFEEDFRNRVQFEIKCRADYNNIYEPPQYKAVPMNAGESKDEALITAVEEAWKARRAPWPAKQTRTR